MCLDKNEINQYHALNEITIGNGIVVFGGTEDKNININELKQAFEVDETIFNRSLTGLKISDAIAAFDACISELIPESILIHIGDKDIDDFKENAEAFDREYISLLSHIRDCAHKCRIGIVSIDNPLSDKTISNMNSHLSEIALSQKCDYCDINDIVWANTDQQKLTSFIINTGYDRPLKFKRPLFNIARMLFGYQHCFNTAIKASNV